LEEKERLEKLRLSVAIDDKYAPLWRIPKVFADID
jgi:hypothetical protein